MSDRSPGGVMCWDVMPDSAADAAKVENAINSHCESEIELNSRSINNAMSSFRMAPTTYNRKYSIIVFVQHSSLTVSPILARLQHCHCALSLLRYEVLPNLSSYNNGHVVNLSVARTQSLVQEAKDKKLSYCWETVRRESMPRIAEIDVEMTT